MRALHLRSQNLGLEGPLKVADQKFHHLKNVLRVKRDDNILILNGEGEGVKAVVSEINKKFIELTKTGLPIKSSDCPFFSAYIGLVKKDALEVCLKSSVELGLKELCFLYTDFSQSYELNLKRVDTIIDNAIEQSNAFWRPEIKLIELKDLSPESIKSSLLFSNVTETDKHLSTLIERKSILLGPEGGFSESEENFLLSNGALGIRLKTNILRTQTALSTSMGYLLGCRDKLMHD